MMHIVIIFHNVGGYHAARLRAAHAICQKQGWQLTAVQETDNPLEHPWGDLEKEITFSLETLLPSKDIHSEKERDPMFNLAANRLYDCLRELQPDILVIPGWGYPISRTALRWTRKHNIPAVLMSESKWDDISRVWWKEKLKSWLYVRNFKSALVGGKLHYDYLVRLGLPKASISYGYDVVDNQHFYSRSEQAKTTPHNIRKKYPAIPELPYFISVSRFIPRKNILRLIDAYAKYRTRVGKDNAWDLVICGSGREELNIKSKIRDYNIAKNVHLPGFQSYQAIPYWFGLANAFIHPALREQWGLVVNEALASGLPALVSNCCGCYPELIVEGVTGFGFDPYNVEQLASLMQLISERKINLENMSMAAIDHIQKFSPNEFAKGLRQAVEYSLN